MPVSKYTSGPWSWAEDPTSPGYFLVRGSGTNVCIMQQKNSDMGMPDDPSWPEAIANARLIAAAPDLLATLIDVRERCLSGDDDGISVSEDVVIESPLFDRICAAINKAEGRTS